MKEELEFFDIKTKNKFKSAEWRIETRTSKGRTRYFAVSRAPGATNESWRIVAKDFALKNM